MIQTLTHDLHEQAHHLAREAREYAMAHGILRYADDGSVLHLPMSLIPWQADAGFVEEVAHSTLLYNLLYHRVASRRDFLQEHLGQASDADQFVRHLFGALAPTPVEKPLLYMNRNDCMPVSQPDGSVQPKQVEMNLMASALGCMSDRVEKMLRFLYAGQDLGQRIVANPATVGLTSALQRGHQAFGDPRAVVVFIVLPGEVNVFDQRVLETALWRDHGVRTLRASLEELGEQAEVRAGDLYFRGFKVAIVYFRAGYAPEHYPNETAWNARGLIERSSAVSVPAAATQLANTKKIQQILSDPAMVGKFLSADEAERLQRSMVAFSPLDEELEWKGQRGPARQVAAGFPNDWVLKPYREGGGNNFFGADMVSRLGSLDARESRAYILMEAIKQDSFRGVRLVRNEVVDGPCVTEMGFFGICLAEPGLTVPTFNEHCGYLLRTKDVENNEGLVLGGYSYLDSAAT